MILYNLKTDKGAAAYGTEQYTITKFDDELNVESSYLVTRTGCLCPQGHKDTCRHRKMLPLMVDRADSAWFYCFDDKQWYDPTGEARFEQVEEARAKVEAGAPAPDLTNKPLHNELDQLFDLTPDEVETARLRYKELTGINLPTKLRRLR